MAKISETELQRRLRSLERGAGSGSNSFSGTADPTNNSSYSDNDTFFNTTDNNLWIFSGGTWDLSNKQLHIRYADDVTNVNTSGYVPAQLDVTAFSELPFSASGEQKPWRGLYWGSTLASTDPTDYEWTHTSGAGAVTVKIFSTSGNIFKNDTGTTQLKANVDIGGSLQTDAQHNFYTYKWLVDSEVVCVDASGNIVSDGLGTIYTDTVATTCISRGAHRADSTDTSVSLNFRQINLSADDIGTVSTLRCEVGNIPN